MDHAVKIMRPDRKSAFLRYMRRMQFADADLEQFYQQYAMKLRRHNVQVCLGLLSLYMLVLSVFHFFFHDAATLKGIYFAFQSCIFVFLLLVLTYNHQNHAIFTGANWVVFASLVVLGMFSLPLSLPLMPGAHAETPAVADGLFSLMFFSCLVYFLLHCPTFMALFYGSAFASAHMVCGAIFAHSPEGMLWNQILANLCVFLWTNSFGLFVQSATEANHRRAFLNMRNALSSKLDVQEEDDKLENLLISAFPKRIALDIKREIRYNLQGLLNNQHVESHHEVSILFADIVNFRMLTAQCNSADLVRILNELMSKIDELATENHCMRIRLLGDRYFCVCGITEHRDNHAQCTVDLAFDILDTITTVGDAVEIPLTVRCGIHSGQVTSGIIGLRKWQYDVWSTDVDIASQLEISCGPGRVHISQTTADLLPANYQVEDGDGDQRNSFLRDREIKTYYLQYQQSLKADGSFPFATGSLGCRGSKRMSFRNVSLSVLRLLHSAKIHSEVPFSSVMGSQDFKYSSLNRKVKVSPSSDKLRRNGRRRSNSLFSPENAGRVNRTLSQTISDCSYEREQNKQIHWLTFRFRDEEDEQMYQDEQDRWLPKSYMCCLLSLLIFGAFHAFVLPRTIASLVMFVLASSWTSLILILLLLQRAKKYSLSILRISSVTSFLCFFTLCIFAASGIVNCFMCEKSISRAKEASACYSPHYIFVSCSISMLVILCFFHQSSVVQAGITLFNASIHLVYIAAVNNGLFLDYAQLHNFSLKVPLDGSAVVAVLLIMSLVLLVARCSEWISRVSYMWKTQESKQREELVQLQRSSQKILFNLLPIHVACHFLDNQFVNNLDLYSSQCPSVTVMSASILNVNDLYDVMQLDGSSADCFHLLHEIISLFDELLFDDKYKSMDKIKTNGPNYMVAVGLAPEMKIEDKSQGTALLADFAFAMRIRLQEINVKYRSKFMMKIGIHSGPVISGVVGAKRPQYDIWGQTVNLACRLDRACLPNHIQASEDVYLAIRGGPFTFEYRGIIRIDDKSELKAYLITSQQDVVNETPIRSKSSRPKTWVAMPGMSEANNGLKAVRNKPFGSHEDVSPSDTRLEFENELESKMPWNSPCITPGVKSKGMAGGNKLFGMATKPTKISAIPEVTDVETDIEELPLLGAYARDEGQSRSKKRAEYREIVNEMRKHSEPGLPPRRPSRPEHLSLSCSFNENLDRLREKSVDSFQQNDALDPVNETSGSTSCPKETPASIADSVAVVVNSPPNLADTDTQEQSMSDKQVSFAYEYSDMSDNPDLATDNSPQFMGGIGANVKKRLKRKGKKSNSNNNMSQSWKRVSTTSSEFEFFEPSPASKTPEKWQIKSFFRTRNKSSSSNAASQSNSRRNSDKQSPPVPKLSPGVKTSPFSAQSTCTSASEFEMDSETKEQLINAQNAGIPFRKVSQNDKSPLDRTGYLAAVYGIPRNSEQKDKSFFQASVPVSKPLGIVYPLPSPACSGYGSDKISQNSPHVLDMLLRRNGMDHLMNHPGSADSAMHAALMSPLAKPFPVNAITQFVDSPDLAYTTATTNLSTSNGVTPATSDSRPMRPFGSEISDVSRPGMRKVFSETDYDNAESDYLCSESESFNPRNFSPESRMLRQPRLLVPGYNLSVIDDSAVSVPRGFAPPMPPPARLTRDDSYIDLMFRGASGSMRRRALGSLQSLDYLGIDTGNEADVDSLASSRCSSRLFTDNVGPGYSWQPAMYANQALLNQYVNASADPAIHNDFMYKNYMPNGAAAMPRNLPGHPGYDSEYDNCRPGMRSDEEMFRSDPVSDMEIDFFDHSSLLNLRRVTSDIQKSFGNVQLSTYSDGDGSP